VFLLVGWLRWVRDLASHSGMTDSGTPIYSSVFKSQKGYSRRVKNNIGKQLIKNENLLAFVADTLTVEEEGYSEGVLGAMELALTLGLIVGDDEKKLLRVFFLSLKRIETVIRGCLSPIVRGRGSLKI
jgi:hypothetical protein